MLQILSTSNETSTGAELVQNGNFSEVGSDLILNGDFSAEGINLVSNPNFTDGVEKIVDGDFPYPNTAWSLNTGVTVPSAGILDFDGTGGAYASQDILTSGNSYKVTIEVADASLTDTLVVFLGATNTILESVVAADTTIVLYGVAGGLNNRVYVGSWEGTITSVSVKELGADWTVVDNDATHYVEFIETGARFVSPTTSPIVQLKQTTFTLLANISYKLTVDMTRVSGGVKFETGGVSETFSATTSGTNNTRYITPTSDVFLTFIRSSSNVDLTFHSVSVQELGADWTLGTGWSIGEDVAISDGSAGSITQSILSADVFYKIRVIVTGNPTLLVFSSTSFYGDEAARTLKNGTHNYYLQAKVAAFSITNEGADACTITNISTEQLDPNGYWTIGTGWAIGADKAISTVTGSNSDITQSILTAGKTYRTVYEIVDIDAGTAQAVVTGSAGADAVAIETYTEDLTTTGTDFSIRSKLGTFDGAVSSVSVKLLGTYDDQSIYVTAADVQTIAQASVYYLVELTSMGSKNSLYFLPSSVVPNNGRYTKLNFTVISKDALPQPTVGIISFYDSVGGFDTYPMGFYEFRIYEQTSSTNLDPLLATGLLEKGFAFVRDFSGNMQELTDGFKEYNPTLTQYVYSK